MITNGCDREIARALEIYPKAVPCTTEIESCVVMGLEV